ncbi:SecY-interacting protein [Rheinheimera sp. UJ63]|uniref:SecY-interacting protein n=1 Tax=Rheinheimera sp. UJ63 TaxID=2910157 RepID=UPI001F25F9B9|nr:SecY-interacting protein [Rheinheimera sp. UJ63]MCF4008104.1 SecY-interacting protein [Rheinheimera sp. UJ63]
MSTEQALAKFIEHSVTWHQATAQPLTAWADPASPSPCQQQWLAEDQVSWLPVAQQPAADFSNIEQALELTLHPSIKAFYSCFYAANMAAAHPRGKLALLLPWNQDDISRLQENIIGHILMKQRLKQRATVFFAVTDDANIMLSLLNSTGEVFLEHVGKEVSEKIADDLPSFLASLTPQAYDACFD